MRVFSKTNRVVFQINRQARHFLNKYVSKNNHVYSHGEQVGELVASGMGWYRIYTNKVNGVRGLLAYVAKQYKTALNNEIRALLTVAMGQGHVVAASANGPFVNYSLASETAASQPKPSTQTSPKVTVPPKGKPSQGSLNALLDRFKK